MRGCGVWGLWTVEGQDCPEAGAASHLGWIQRELPHRKERGLEPLVPPWGTQKNLG